MKCVIRVALGLMHVGQRSWVQKQATVEQRRILKANDKGVALQGVMNGV